MKAKALCRRIPILGTALLAFDCSRVAAQEALGEAVQVERSRKARKEAIDRNLYPLKAGPVLLRFDALMGFEFNDNPNLLDDPEDVDFIFHPQLDIASLWPINARNALSLNLGIGYMKYVENDELDHVIIAPTSELSFDIRTGDVLINLHERVSYTQDPVTDPTVSGTGDFGAIENTVGVRADWDLNKLLISLGYDHQNIFATGSPLSEAQDRSSELFYGAIGLNLRPGLRTGLELGGALNDYTTDVFADNEEFSVGPYVEVDVTKELQARLAGGYIRYTFGEPVLDTSITNVLAEVPSEINDFYANLTLNHQLNQFMSHNLSLGREARAGAASELVTMWFARYGNTWNFSRLTALNTQLFYEDGRERAGFSTERFWRVGAGVSVGIPLSRQLTTDIGYQFLYKDSDETSGDYLQNRVALEFRYVF